MTEADDWADATIAGFRAMGQSRYREAAGHWLAAQAMLASVPADDPRHAASKTNTGVARHLLREAAAAEAALAEAEQRWMRLLRRAAAADAPLSGHSSAFHFRLASQNLQAFQETERRRLTRQCEAGLAITRFNRLLAGGATTTDDSILRPLIALLSDILGPRSPEARLLRMAARLASETLSADSLYADKVAELAQRLVPLAGEPVADWRSLEPAVALTVLLRPGLPFDAGERLQDDPRLCPRSPPIARSSST